MWYNIGIRRKEKMQNVEQIREKTRKDLEEKLQAYGKCALVRCTGFGKTWLLSSLTQKYNKVLYLYPAEVIKNTVENVVKKSKASKKMQDIEEENMSKQFQAKLKAECEELDTHNITFMTYMKLIRLSDEDFEALLEYDLIIFDECHRLGAEKTRLAVDKLFETCSDAKFIGATATPDRSDSFDVIDTFFDNIVVYPYTLHDAIQDGIIKKPYYCYCTYDIETDLKEAALTAGEDVNNITVREVLKSKLIEISQIYNLETIIKDTITKYAKEQNYLKFIVFFDGFKQLKNKGEDVRGWFQKAFPNYSINALTITSQTKQESENVAKLDELVYRDKGIDLIYCVDMLNMGYHVNDLTGIVMYRGTSSSIIFNQQLGRALSTGNENSCIVFDIVDNLHRKCVYELYDKSKVRKRKRKTLPTAEAMTEIDVTDMIKEEIDELREQFKEDRESSGLEPEKWWKFCNDFGPEDLYATGHEATYRELIAKAVAEPVAQRCKRAQEEHFKRWCIMNSQPYPSTRAELIKKDLMPPLEPYARWQNVTVGQILDEMEKGGDWNTRVVNKQVG